MRSCRSAYPRAFWRNLRVKALSSSKPSIVRASVRGSRQGVRSPLSPWVMNSRTGSVSPPMTGQPIAIASRIDQEATNG